MAVVEKRNLGPVRRKAKGKSSCWGDLHEGSETGIGSSSNLALDFDTARRDALRHRLQSMLDGGKSQGERNRLGQFSTPDQLADQIVRVARSFLGTRRKVDILEPAFGTGAFFAAVIRSLGDSELGRCVGYEVDPHYGVPALEIWEGTRVHIHIGDFTAVSPPTSENKRFDLVATNPPYVRHHHIEAGMKERIRKRAQQVLGHQPSGLSGLYPYFVYLAHEWMRADGIGAWLIPSEFMYVDYGCELRNYLLKQVTLLRIHRFDPEDLQFDDAVVSSAVVFFRNALPDHDHTALFTFGRSISRPDLSCWVPIRDLDGNSKWRDLHAYRAPRESKGIRLGSIFSIRRGLATGANSFFILDEAKVEEYGLPREWLRPMLPSPRYLDADVIQSGDGGNPLISDRRFLLSCDLVDEKIQEKHPRLWAYLMKGMAQGLHERYLCSHRSPWYKQENARPAPLLCSYMGHSRNGNRPFRFILNQSAAVASNTYLGLYPRRALEEALCEDPGLLRTIHKALTELATESLLAAGRTYGGRLHKLEPGDLAEVCINVPEIERLATK